MKLVINNANPMRVESRTTSYNPFGKCDETIRTMVPYQMKDKVLSDARSLGMNESEFIRMVLMLYLYGESEVKRIEQKRIESVAEKGKKGFLRAAS